MKLKKNLLALSFSIALAPLAKAQSVSDGLSYYENERFSKAVGVFTQLLNAQPKAEYAFYLGEIYLAKENVDSARYYFQKGIAIDPKSSANYIGLASINLADDKTEEAKKNFAQAVSLGNKEAQTYILIGEAYTNTEHKNLNAAIENLNTAIKLDPKNARAYVSLGDAYLEKNDGSQANNNYEKALSVNPKYTRALVQQGTLWIRARNADLAEKSLTKAIETDPNFAPSYRELAELQYLKKQYAQATETYKKYMALTDNTLDSRIRYAKFLFLSKEYQQAIDEIKTVFAKDSSNIILRRLLGYSLYETGKYPEGLRYMNAFMNTSDPKKIIVSDYEYLGKLQAKNKESDAALASFNKALEMDREKTELYGDMAAVYYGDKKYAEAAAMYEKKLESGARRSSSDYFRLGQSYYYAYGVNKADTSALRKADNAFAKVAELSPNHPSGYLWRGRISSVDLENAKDKSLAKPYFDRVVEIGVADEAKFKNELIEAYRYLAYLAIQNDKKAEAKAYYEKILTLDPGNQEASENIKRLK